MYNASSLGHVYIIDNEFVLACQCKIKVCAFFIVFDNWINLVTETEIIVFYINSWWGREGFQWETVVLLNNRDEPISNGSSRSSFFSNDEIFVGIEEIQCVGGFAEVQSCYFFVLIQNLNYNVSILCEHFVTVVIILIHIHPNFLMEFFVSAGLALYPILSETKGRI